MPQTLNTIGTRYAGRKNVVSRNATCPHCHQSSVLTSYDTRLCFVVLFIPIIPLARKHIIDQCSRCTNHYAVPAAKWEAHRKQDVAAAAERFAAQPTPETAILVHARLVDYLELEKAAEFRALMLAKFPDNASIHECVGLALGRLGQNDDAMRHLERAFALQPELPTPRVNIALRRIREGQLDEARTLLSFLLQPGAAEHYSLDALFALGNALESQQRPRDALEIYNHLLRETPAFGQSSAFRKILTRLERATGETTSALPKKQFFQTSGAKAKFVTAVIVVALILGTLVVVNESIRRGRTLHIVNGFDQPLTVEIPGQQATTIRPHDYASLTMAEGDYVARVSGATTESVPFSLRSDYFDRWSGHPMWILNPGGAEILERVTGVYSKNGDEAGDTGYLYGERFFTLPEVKHPFSKLPERVMVERRSSKRLTSVNRFELEPALLHDHLASTVSLQGARQFAEARLAADPNDENLLMSYARRHGAEDPYHIRSFLKAGLARRPVAVSWHRLYQAFNHGKEREEGLRDEYDAMLAAEPKDPALLYLRAQISPSREEAARFHGQARALDPQHPYVLLPQAIADVAKGDLEAALPKLEAAAKAAPKDAALTSFRDAVRVALGKFTDLVAEIRGKLRRNPIDFAQITKLVGVLVAQGDPKTAFREVELYIGQLRQKQAKHIEEPAEVLRYTVQHLTGNFTEAEKILAKSTAAHTPAYRFALLLDQLKPAEAMAMPDVEDLVQNNVAHLLAASIAWQLTGDPTRAAEAREDAAALFEEGDSEQRLAGEMLVAATPPTPAELDALILDPADKCALCVALGQKFPAESGRCFALARKLNFLRVFPYHIIARATAE